MIMISGALKWSWYQKSMNDHDISDPTSRPTVILGALQFPSYQGPMNDHPIRGPTMTSISEAKRNLKDDIEKDSIMATTATEPWSNSYRHIMSRETQTLETRHMLYWTTYLPAYNSPEGWGCSCGYRSSSSFQVLGRDWPSHRQWHHLVRKYANGKALLISAL